MTGAPSLLASYPPIVLCGILLLPLAPVGLIVMYSALSRARNAAHTALTALLAISVGTIAFVLIGARLLGAPGAADWTIVTAHHAWNWLAHPSHPIQFADSAALLWLVTEAAAASLVCLIPAVAISERWRLAPVAGLATVLAGLLFPVFAHAVRTGGWIVTLAQPSAPGNFQVDPGGTASIQILGGFAALALVWVMGPRQGKYDAAGRPMALPGHHLPQVMYGALLALPGWTALNLTQWTLHTGLSEGGALLVVLNTWIAAAAAALAALLTSRWRFAKPDVSLTANGWVAGLVVSSAAAQVRPSAMLLLALVAGALTVIAVEFLEVRLRIDDPAGVIAVHACAGLWGLLAGNFWASRSGLAIGGWAPPRFGTLSTWVAVLTLAGAILPLVYLVASLLHRFNLLRVDPDAEQFGLDLHELGGSSFPDFMNSGEDWYRHS